MFFVMIVKKSTTSRDDWPLISFLDGLYGTLLKSEEISSVVSKVKPHSTLIITAKQGLVEKGAGINFIVKNNRQKFELNKKNVEKYKLKINSNLEALAFAVK